MKSQRPVQYVRDASALEALAGDLASSERIALDTEFMRERTYYARLCLVQVATDDLMAVVDPLACENLEPLWNVVTGGPEVVFHAASQDLEIIIQEAGALPAAHFDTQVAASFLGYGDSIGHSRLVASLTGNTLGRSEAYTDWARRPLSQEQVDYALDDVRYLLSMRDRLGAELETAGRAAWVEQELAALASRVRAEPDVENLWRRVKGGRGLRGGKLAVLREVAAWREKEAQRRDIPRQRVLPDHVLAEVSRRTPRRIEQIERLRGVNPREAQRSGDALLAAVARGLELPPEQHPDWGAPAPHAADPRIDAFA
ncbi:MAG: ribonuclease D, partial [Gammaproteobacteria bacterium]|nr:ribonuclease D [Gammaproteobacteria bacterium]